MLDLFREFALSSLQHFPFTMFVSFLIMGFIFFQPTWSLVSIGMLLTYLVVQLFQLALKEFLPDTWVAQAYNSGNGDFNPCYPYSTTARNYHLPSEWITQVSFLFTFIIYNSYIVGQKEGNKKLADAHQRRQIRVELSTMASVILLIAMIILRLYTGCDNTVSAIISTLLGAGLAIGYYTILDICNTQLHSDILGITRNMAPRVEEDVAAVVCQAGN